MDIELPPDLKFRFQLNKQLLASISMNNPNDKRVAFKIKTTAPKKYVVRPSSGVVEPRASLAIQVIMQAQKEHPPDFQNCKDKFMVQTTVLADSEQLDKETFNKDLRKDLKEHRLKVVLEGPAAPPSPVPEANENDDESAHRAAAATAAAAASDGAGAAEARPRSSLTTASDASAETSALKAQLEKALRDRDDARRQLDMLQLQSASSKGRSAAAQDTAQRSKISIIPIILVAILAFIVGHYLKH